MISIRIIPSCRGQIKGVLPEEDYSRFELQFCRATANSGDGVALPGEIEESGSGMRKPLQDCGKVLVCSAVSGVLTLETVPCYARSGSVSANSTVFPGNVFLMVGLA
jgi:hypothetical protein